MNGSSYLINSIKESSSLFSGQKLNIYMKFWLETLLLRLSSIKTIFYTGILSYFETKDKSFSPPIRCY